MGVRIYSTLSSKEEELVPLHEDGVLRMYVCGMTPKFHPHVGHARTFVAMDVMRRYLLFRGYKVKYVQNFTDIDDKIIDRAASQGRTAEATAREYMESYLAVMDVLGVQRADFYPTVTGYMERIVEFIAGLVESDHGYAIDSGDVYFDVSSFPEYGKLSHRDLNSQLVAARKELEPGKRDPRDFALWKRARDGEPSWPSPWGRGRPGWHIECSAMVRETLGDQIDIHGGGADLIFPHHENEIAQSESLTGKVPFARHWTHTGLVVLGGGEKMAHSADNFTTLASILDQYAPVEVRFWLIGTHYRSSLTFSVDADNGSAASVRGIEDARGALARLRRAVGPEPLDLQGPLDATAVAAFQAAMDADFNTPDALAVIFDLARKINTLRAGDSTLVTTAPPPLAASSPLPPAQKDFDRVESTAVAAAASSSLPPAQNDLDRVESTPVAAASSSLRPAQEDLDRSDSSATAAQPSSPPPTQHDLDGAEPAAKTATSSSPSPAQADIDHHGREGTPPKEEIDRGRRTLVHLLDVLGIDLSVAAPSEAASIEPFVDLHLAIRKKLRDIKQWALADEIRDRLKDLGVIVEDKPGGESTWRMDR